MRSRRFFSLAEAQYVIYFVKGGFRSLFIDISTHSRQFRTSEIWLKYVSCGTIYFYSRNLLC